MVLPAKPELDATERELLEQFLDALERIASAVETMALAASARVAIETRGRKGDALDSSSRCDHKFIGSSVCLKCGWWALKQ